MNRMMIPTLIFLIMAAPASADPIAGLWVPPGGDAVIEISTADDTRLILLRTLDSKTRDSQNPDPGQRNRSLAGIELGRGFRRDGNSWKQGKIYDPASGKTYSAQLELIDSNHLRLRGYIGTPLFGRTETWLRYSEFKTRMSEMLAMECSQ